MLGALFVKHYTENIRKYIVMYGVSIAVPILFGLLARRSEVAHAMAITVLIIDVFVVMHISMNELRDRGSAIVSNMLPVSVTERYAFIFLNTTLIFALCFFAAEQLSMAVIDAIYPPAFDMSRLFPSGSNFWANLCGTHAAAMLINAVARRRLIVTYIAAFLISIVCQYAMVCMAGDDMLAFNDLKMYGNLVLAPLFWVGSFLLLRRKQINW